MENGQNISRSSQSIPVVSNRLSREMDPYERADTCQLSIYFCRLNHALQSSSQSVSKLIRTGYRVFCQ